MHVKSTVRASSFNGAVTGVLAIRAATDSSTSIVYAIGVFETVTIHSKSSLIFFRSSSENQSELLAFAHNNHRNHDAGEFQQNWLSAPSYDHIAATTVHPSQRLYILDYNIRLDEEEWHFSNFPYEPYAISLTTATTPEILWIGTKQVGTNPLAVIVYRVAGAYYEIDMTADSI